MEKKKATRHITGQFVGDRVSLAVPGTIVYRRGHGLDAWKVFDGNAFVAEHTLGCPCVEDAGLIVSGSIESGQFEVVVEGEFPRDGVRGDLDAAVQAGLLTGVEFVSTTPAGETNQAVPAVITEATTEAVPDVVSDATIDLELLTVDGEEVSESTDDADSTEAPVVDD